jgi:hypothetical protein
MGAASMYQVHKFMDLNPNQVGYFIQQVALAGASFGVTASDLQAVGTALDTLFNKRCSPPAAAIAAQGPQLQSICIDGSCPLSPNATCSSYEPVVIPRNATTNATVTAPGSLGSATSTVSGSPTMTATGTMRPSTIPTAGAVVEGVSLAAVLAGIAAFLV